MPSCVIINRSPQIWNSALTGEMSDSVCATTRSSGSSSTNVEALNSASAAAPNRLPEPPARSSGGHTSATYSRYTDTRLFGASYARGGPLPSSV